MNAIRKSDGHSIRRNTIDNSRSTLAIVSRARAWSMFPFIIAVMFALTSCHEKSNGQSASLAHKEALVSDSLHKPKIDIKVNRHYNEKGEMIGFDSTYSSYYSNIQGDTIAMDTLFKGFDSYFKNSHSSLFGKQFNDLFFRDSLVYPDFFHNDFFQKRYELNDLYLRDMMQRMDSVKNRFYREQSDRKRRAKDL
jgi:hypothetical protein